MRWQPIPVRTPVALLVLAFCAGNADAKVPDSRFSSIPAVIAGSPSGASLPSCGGPAQSSSERASCFRVVLRDVNNSPLPYVPVTLDLGQTACRVYADANSGTTVDCTARTITRVTGRDGVVEFAPRFSGGCPDALVKVMADGFSLRDIPARSTDLDLDGRTGLEDFWRVAQNFLHAELDPATDFDPCAGAPGTTSLADLSVFSAVFIAGGAGTACP